MQHDGMDLLGDGKLVKKALWDPVGGRHLWVADMTCPGQQDTDCPLRNDRAMSRAPQVLREGSGDVPKPGDRVGTTERICWKTLHLGIQGISRRWLRSANRVPNNSCFHLLRHFDLLGP